jgi:hypothetical protein
MSDPFRDAYDKHMRAHRFELCEKCGAGHPEAVYVICPRGEAMPGGSGHYMLWQEANPTLDRMRQSGWIHSPGIPRAHEGFYVRCKRCQFAWYEELKPPEDRSATETGHG